MESLSDTEWDVVISGTGLQQSLLALALSRSGKKVLHVDRNEYYGGAEAAFSLQEAEEWVEKVKYDGVGPFANASLWKAGNDDKTTGDNKRLSFSRAYTLALSPQIIYSRSRLLSQLVSSKVYRQLEFQAVGSWWLYDTDTNTETYGLVSKYRTGTLKRLPNGREDVFSDSSIDLRAKRSLMKFLKFVVDYENQPDVWKTHADESFPEFLSTSFKLPGSLQTVILALTLSLQLPAETSVKYSLPRVARHLKSIGVFGPGFGAVVPKWGGASEIAQVACRAGAVGGGVYMLGTSIQELSPTAESHITLTLTNDDAIHTRTFVTSRGPGPETEPEKTRVSKMIAIVSSDLSALFAATVEGAPTAAVTVVTFPSLSLNVDGQLQLQPIYIMVNSSDTGECPAGQCVLYARTLSTSQSKKHIEAAVSALLSNIPSLQTESDDRQSLETQEHRRLLYTIYFEQEAGTSDNAHSGSICSLASPSVDLAFDDTALDNVEDAWRTVIGFSAVDAVSQPDLLGSYMAFEDRGGIVAEEDDPDDI